MWEIYWKSMENMGNLWEIYGKYIGNISKSMGNSMESSGNMEVSPVTGWIDVEKKNPISSIYHL